MWTQVSALATHTPRAALRADHERLNALADRLFAHARQAGMAAPRLSVDALHEFTFAPALTALIYERHHEPCPIQARLGAGIAAVSESEALANALDSDFVLLGTPPGAASPYPFDQAMAPLRSKLRALCDRELVRLGTFQVLGDDLDLYVRPTAAVEGDSGGWITDRGLVVSCAGGVLRTRPVVQLRGRFNPEWLGGPPQVRAVLEGQTQAVAADCTVTGDQYAITLTIDPAALDPDRVARVRVTFDRAFVPDRVLGNGDQRALVVRTPTAVTLARSAAGQ